MRAKPIDGLRCGGYSPRRLIDLRRRLEIERLVTPLVVVKLEILSQPSNSLFSAPVLVQIDLFIFDTPPEPFNKHVVQSPAPTVHADRNLVLFQHTCKRLAGELYTLITVEDLRLSPDQRPVQR